MARHGGPAGRYAVALFSIARERGTIDAWADELRRLAAVVADPAVARVLGSPGVAIRQKQEALESVAGPLSREVGSLLTILLERKRVDKLPELAEAFADLARAQKGIALADVTSAVPLAAPDQQYVEGWLARYLGRPVETRFSVDPEIIGGVVARVGDQLIDASVRGRLETLRKQLRSA
ncbi:MAG TPA: ATP synthase F1 subunit delta [Chloroflexota bacterium]|nr:ATP synthase F1 subunit delta [Chloroflexota bacterium]